MRNRLNCCLLAVLLSATSAFAQFEGVMQMKITLSSRNRSERGGGTLNIALSKAGMRGELTMQVGPGMSMNNVVLCKTDTPNTNYQIDDATRTYTEINPNQPTDPVGQSQDKGKWTVKKLGQQKILGYKTQHVLAKPNYSTGGSMEMWIATDFLDYETFVKLQACTGGNQPGNEGLAQALKEARAEGMPLKVVIATGEGVKVTMKVVKVEKKALPASTFEIPAGYTKSVNGIWIMTGPEAEAAKARMEEARRKMEEQMKKMSPEQRTNFQKMMEQLRRGSQ